MSKKKNGYVEPSPTIGEVIKAARIKLSYRADDVAEACNVSRSRVYQWESADFILPKNFKRLSEVLNLSVSKLLAANGDRHH